MTQQGKAYTDHEKVAIIERIAEGLMEGKSLRQICNGHDLPPKATILRWLSQSDCPDLVTTIARARALQCDAKFDEMDEVLEDVRSKVLDPHSARVIIWALQWQLSKMQPKKYGERLTQDLTVTERSPVQQITADMDAETAARLYREMIQH